MELMGLEGKIPHGPPPPVSLAMALVMEIHHSISQNILSFLVEKIFDFKVDSCPQLQFPIP